MQRQRILSLFLAALMLCLTVFPASAASEESATASTIQLMKTEGTVSVTNGTGRGLTTRDNMRLYNGYHTGTGAKSYAWINLDDQKLSKLDSCSEVEVRKSGKKLEMLLNSGNIYFNVTSPLETEETLNIRTSTMAVGIRGTSGCVRVLDRWRSEIYILEGTVQVSVEDPVTGQVKTELVHGGEKVIAVAYPQEQAGDKCDILRERYTWGDIDGFVLEELVQDPALCGDIYEETGMDAPGSMGLLDSIRRQLDAIRDELDKLREQIERGEISHDEAQARLDEIRRQLEDLRRQLEELGPDADARKRLEDAGEYLRQAQEALDNARTGEALDRLVDARDALEDSRQRQSAGAQAAGKTAARARREQDEQALQDRLDDIEDRLSWQDNNISDDPVWEQDNSAPAATTSGGGSSRGRTVTGQMPLTDAEVQALLDGAGTRDTVRLVPDEDPAADNTLYITTTDGTDTLTVDSGKTLSLSDGINVKIENEPGNELIVNGTMTGTGDLVNAGTLTVNSSNTLRMGSISNDPGGTLTNTLTGRIEANIHTAGSLTNDGRIEGCIDVNGGVFVMNNGEVTSSYDDYTLMVTDGAEQVRFSGGLVTNSGNGYALNNYRDTDRTSFDGTHFRSMYKDNIITSEIPDGYVITDTAQSDGYYYLWPEGTQEPPQQEPPQQEPPQEEPPQEPEDPDEPEGPDTPAGPFIVTYGEIDKDYTYSNNVLSILTDTALTIRNSDEYPEYVPSPNRIEVSEENSRGANVTLAGVRISIDNSSSSSYAAFLIPDDYEHDVTITLADGSDNILNSGQGCAGLQKNGEAAGELTITGGGSLTATGGQYGAGIGAGNRGSVSNITINGSGTVTASGGSGNYGGAGIGAGYAGGATGISISGTGTVEARAGNYSAGIGGGESHDGTNITIAGSVTVKATGGGCVSSTSGGGAGIGSGSSGNGTYITIKENAYVEATGADGGAGIGGGYRANGEHIRIEGGRVFATGSADASGTIGNSGAGIGGGSSRGSGFDITITGSAHVEATGGGVTGYGRGATGYAGAGIGGGGYGAGMSGTGYNITISGNAYVTATGGYGDKCGGAGIGNGGGGGSNASNIRIESGTVIARGGNAGSDATGDNPGGAGIGGGGTNYDGSATGITILGGDVTVSGGSGPNGSGNRIGAGIGCGAKSNLSSVLTSTNITITGGTITNDGNGYTVQAEDDGTTTVERAVFKSKTRNFFAGSSGVWVPDGYTVSDERVTNSYYWLRPVVELGPFTVTGGTVGDDVSYNEATRVLTISTDTPLTIRNTRPAAVEEYTTARIEIAEENARGANLTFTGVRINLGESGGAAFLIPDNYGHDVSITLADGSDNLLRSGSLHAGLEKDGADSIGWLTIAGGTGENAGKLTATGVWGGAGIGGSSGDSTTNIRITGGIVTATGAAGSGNSGAGIGGGGGSGSHIEISGGTVTATGGANSAGIGGGSSGSANTITISNAATVEATGNGGGAGIGGGNGGSADTIIINNAANVKATGGDGGDGGGAGIGSGSGNGLSGSNIEITNSTVEATGNRGGAGIGGGYCGTGNNITITGGKVTATGSFYIDGGSAGIGGGFGLDTGHSSANTIRIGGGADVTATGGSGAAGIGGGNGGSNVEKDSNGGYFRGGYNITIGDATITNEGDGYAVNAENTAGNVTINGAVFRSRGNGGNNDGYFFVDNSKTGWNPPGYNVSDETASTGYYWLRPGITNAGPFIVMGGVEYTDFEYNEGTRVLTVLTNVPLVISNAEAGSTDARIELSNATPAVDYHITLNGVRISSTSNAAFLIPDNYAGDVTVYLAGGSENELTGGAGCAGLQKNNDLAADPSALGTLTITGSGKLTATGGVIGITGNNGGAGIGGGSGYSTSNITVESGTVTANGMGLFGGAGIGGGTNGNGTYITISGGTVTAEGGHQGAGIGGGANSNGFVGGPGNGSNITISGGTVTAAGETGIGGGSNGAGTDITIEGGIVTVSGNAASIGGNGNNGGANITIKNVTVTNEGTCYIVRADEDGVTLDGAVFRSKGNGGNNDGYFFVDNSGSGWNPENYAVTGPNDEEDYYTLARHQSSGDLENDSDSDAGSRRPGAGD